MQLTFMFFFREGVNLVLLLQSVSDLSEHGVQMQSDTVHNFDGQTSISAKAGLSVSSGKGSVFFG